MAKKPGEPLHVQAGMICVETIRGTLWVSVNEIAYITVTDCKNGHFNLFSQHNNSNPDDHWEVVHSVPEFLAAMEEARNQIRSLNVHVSSVHGDANYYPRLEKAIWKLKDED